MTSPGAQPKMAPVKPEPAQIGILLVHGIGDQKPSETIAAFAEPMASWLIKWLEGVNRIWVSEGLTSPIAAKWLDSLNCGNALSAEEAKKNRDAIAEASPELQLTAENYGAMSPDCLARWELLRPILEDRTLGRGGRGSDGDITAIAKRAELPFVAVRARVADAHIEAPSDEWSDRIANATLQLDTLRPDGALQSEQWLFAEAHWARSFVPPSAKRVALWSAFVCPYIIATLLPTHFYLALDTLAGKRSDVWRGFGVLRLLLTVVIFALLAPITLLAQVLILSLAALTLIPIEIVRKRIVAIQRILSTIVGDSYTFLESASNRASIVARIEERLKWLAKRCKYLVIVAHSQGAYVALETLRSVLPQNLRLFVTVGSGISRLGALSKVHGRHGLNLRIGIGLAVVGTCFVTFGVYRFINGEHRLWVLILIAAQTLWLAFLFVVLGSDPGGGHDVDPGWFGLLQSRRIRWLDYKSAYDPVPNRQWGKPGIEPQEMSNLDSIALDHTHYWSNADQFLPSLINAIARAGDSHVRFDQLTKVDSVMLEFAARWRPYRVAWLRAGTWLLTIAAASVLVRRWDNVSIWGADVRRLSSLMPIGLPSRVTRWFAVTRDHDLGIVLLLAVWGSAVLIIWLAWLLWQKRDENLLSRRFFVTLNPEPIQIPHHARWIFFLSLSGALTFAASTIFELPQFRWPISLGSGRLPALTIVFAAFYFLLRVTLAYDYHRTLTRVVKRRSRKLLDHDAALKLSGLPAFEFAHRCSPIDEQFDALAFDDSSYREGPLYDEDDVLKARAKANT